MKRKNFCSALCAFLAILTVCSCCVFSAGASNSTEMDEGKYMIDESMSDIESDIIVEVSAVTEIETPANASINESIDIEYIIFNSDSVVARGTSLSGKYESGKYDAGCAGYKYKISFSWTAKVNSEGEYVFDTITNPVITTYENWVVLAFVWGYANYNITNNVYYKSNGGKSLTFETTYHFVTIDNEAKRDEYDKVNKKIIALDSIR